jgi:hypothetical protein
MRSSSWRLYPDGAAAVRLPDPVGTALFGAAVVVSVAVAWWAATGPSALRFVAAAAVAVAVIAVGTVAPPALFYFLVPWFAALGLSRRVFSVYSPSGVADPFLVVGPLALGILAIVAIQRGALRDQTALTKAILALSLLVLLGAVNPLQGSLTAGVVSLLFVFVPLLGFFIGRAVPDNVLRTFLRLLGVLGLGVALYGLAQTIYGFLPWDASWIQAQRDYTSLGVFTAGGGGAPVTRPFGTASSAAEYGYLLAITLVIWAAGGVTTRLLPRLAAVSVILVAIVLESSRGILVVSLVGLLMVVAARRKAPLWLGVAVVAVAILSLPFALSFVHFGTATTPVGTLVGHQLEGIRDPLNPETSTLGLHLDIIAEGLQAPLSNPLGLGLSAVTIAGERFGATVGGATEADISNVGVALGIPGMLVYVVVLVLALRCLYTVAIRRENVLAHIGFAIGLILVLQWLNGGMYSVAWLPWLMIGWADRQQQRG